MNKMSAKLTVFLKIHFGEGSISLKFSCQKDNVEFEDKKINPKRLQREVKRVMQNDGIGTSTKHTKASA